MRGIIAIFFLVVQGFAAFNLTWGVPAVSLDSNPPAGDSDFNPTIAIDPLGNATAAWGRTSGMGAIEDIWAASYKHEARIWTGAVKISGGGSSSNSIVAMDENGNTLIVWEEGFPTQIRSRTLSAEGVWSPPLASPPLSISPSSKAQESPQVVIDGAGNALAIWMQSNRIFSAKKGAGLGWEPLGAISSGSNRAEICLSNPLALNASGDGIAVWQESDGQICGARYVVGEWKSPFFASPGEQPSVAIDSAGNAVLVWNGEKVIQSKSLIDGALSDTAQIISNPLFQAQHPCVAIDDAGNAVVVFERLDAALMHKFIVGATLVAGGAAWSSPVDLSVPSLAEGASAGYPKLRLNSIGDGVAIWKEFDGSHLFIQGAGCSLGSWSLARTLSSIKDNSGSLLPGYNMGIAINLAGNTIAIWPEDPSGSNAQHIKVAPGMNHIMAIPGVGIAVESPPPPVVVDMKSLAVGIGVGRQEKHRFPGHSDLINILEWSSPGGVAYYKIYRGNLSSLIGTATEPHFEDHQRVPSAKATYLITSVDIHEHESVPMTIIVHP